MSKEQTGDQIFTIDDMEEAQNRWADYTAGVVERVQYLIDYLDGLGHLEEGIFTFPDGETWASTRLIEDANTRTPKETHE